MTTTSAVASTWGPPQPLNGQVEVSARATAGAEMARRRWRLMTRDDLELMPKADQLVEGLLPRAGLAMLAGSRGLGKSLLTLDICAHVATGLPFWCGRALPRHGPVLYIAMEGFDGIPERVRAWEAVAERRCERVVWLSDRLDLKRTIDAELLGALAADLGASVVVTDSARATGAGAEDTRDMSSYVEGLEVVQSAFGGLVLVVHNTGWDGSRERGSTLLPDACDTTLLLSGNPRGVRTLEHRKHRDGESLTSGLTFEFRPAPGTKSGVLVPCSADGAETMRDRLQALIEREPGQSTGRLAGRIGANRSNVATALGRLAAEGLLHNAGTRERPAWEISVEQSPS